MFTIYAYKSKCPYSTKILNVFKELETPAKLFLYEKYIEKAPECEQLNTLPRIYFNGHLIADCTHFINALNYAIKNKNIWTDKTTEGFIKKLKFAPPKSHVEKLISTIRKMISEK